VRFAALSSLLSYPLFGLLEKAEAPNGTNWIPPSRERFNGLLSDRLIHNYMAVILHQNQPAGDKHNTSVDRWPQPTGVVEAVITVHTVVCIPKGYGALQVSLPARFL
jgi:hypothetical protein